MRTAVFLTSIFALLFLNSCSIDEEQAIFDLNESLVAHYPFDGTITNKTTPDIATEINGTSLTFDRYSTPESAVAFDGIDDFIRIASDEKLQLGNEFTISVWMKTDAIIAQQIVYKGYTKDIDVASYGISLSNHDGKEGEEKTHDLIFSTTPDKEVQELKMLNYEKEQWYMVTCVLEDDVMFLYINGKPAVLKYIDGDLSKAALPIWIGNSPSKKRPFQGSIDDLRIYNEAKSPDFVSYLYEN